MLSGDTLQHRLEDSVSYWRTRQVTQLFTGSIPGLVSVCIHLETVFVATEAYVIGGLFWMIPLTVDTYCRIFRVALIMFMIMFTTIPTCVFWVSTFSIFVF